MYTVYIIYSQTADRYYVGHTSDVVRRLTEHNQTNEIAGKYTRKNGPWELVYREENYFTRADAMQREKEIKNWKSRKKIMQLITIGGAPNSEAYRD
jgi:putative endonuclease